MLHALPKAAVVSILNICCPLEIASMHARSLICAPLSSQRRAGPLQGNSVLLQPALARHHGCVRTSAMHGLSLYVQGEILFDAGRAAPAAAAQQQPQKRATKKARLNEDMPPLPRCVSDEDTMPADE